VSIIQAPPPGHYLDSPGLMSHASEGAWQRPWERAENGESAKSLELLNSEMVPKVKSTIPPGPVTILNIG